MEEIIDNVIKYITEDVQYIRLQSKSYSTYMKYIGYTIPEELEEQSIRKITSELSLLTSLFVKYSRSKKCILVRLQDCIPNHKEGIERLNRMTEDYLDRIIKHQTPSYHYTSSRSQQNLHSRPYNKNRMYHQPTKSSS